MHCPIVLECCKIYNSINRPGDVMKFCCSVAMENLLRGGKSKKAFAAKTGSSVRRAKKTFRMDPTRGRWYNTHKHSSRRVAGEWFSTFWNIHLGHRIRCFWMSGTNYLVSCVREPLSAEIFLFETFKKFLLLNVNLTLYSLFLFSHYDDHLLSSFYILPHTCLCQIWRP
jgi:hypothetical protein